MSQSHVTVSRLWVSESVQHRIYVYPAKEAICGILHVSKFYAFEVLAHFHITVENHTFDLFAGIDELPWSEIQKRANFDILYCRKKGAIIYKS